MTKSDQPSAEGRLKRADFIEIAKQCNCNANDIMDHLKEIGKPTSVQAVYSRLRKLKAKGLLPLDSGNTVESGQILKGTATYHYGDKATGKPAQWIRTDVDKENQLAAFKEAVESIASSLSPLPPMKEVVDCNEETTSVYISNDIHFGALCWAPESGTDWDLKIAESTVREAYDTLVQSTPASKYAIVVDLGDLMEMDDHSNMTPKSGNVLAVDGRYPKVLRAAYESLIYGIQRALEKHELVYFYNVEGNHDMSSAHAIREIIYQAFKDEPRVIIDESPSPIKYHQFNEVLLQFFHGDGMKMRSAGEAMAVDCQSIFSETKFRYGHSGHTHKDAVLDTAICRIESHRNLAGLNHWAHAQGYRSPLGTMKAITYHKSKGEIARNLYTLI